MNCALLDMGCHASQVAFDLWHGLSLPSKLLIIVGLLSIAGAAALRGQRVRVRRRPAQTEEAPDHLRGVAPVTEPSGD